MKVLFITGFLVGFSVVLYFVWYRLCYMEYKKDCVGKIKFNQFLLFYNISESSPNISDRTSSWELKDGYVVYRWKYKHYYDKEKYFMVGDYAFLYFSPFDTIRYQIWRERLKRSVQNKNNNKLFAVVLEHLQEDIDKYKESNAKT